MATVNAQSRVGSMLKEWRKRRRLSQLDLALDAGVSTRHLSFVETGRSKPGRDLLLRICGQLEIPFRERNQLLLAAGYAPAFPERSLDDPALEPVREALDLILTSHEPNPAVVFDRGWNLVAANSPMLAMAAGIEIDPALLEPPLNVLRVGLHPRGFAPLIVNLGEWRAHFLERLERQVAITGDRALADLLDEVSSYPAPPAEPRHGLGQSSRDILGPVAVRAPDGGELAFFGMFATFDTPFEVTTSELAVELLFPADARTAAAVRDFAAAGVEGDGHG